MPGRSPVRGIVMMVGAVNSFAEPPRQSQFCGAPGSQQARDWLAVRDTLASLTIGKLAKRPQLMETDNPIFSFTDLPAFDDCPLGALALRLTALQSLSVKSDGLMRYPFHDEWALIMQMDLWEVARNSGWGSVVFGGLMDLRLRICEERESVCSSLQANGDESECVRCEWPGGQFYDIQAAAQMHVTAMEEFVLSDTAAVAGCDWESATAIAGVLWGNLQNDDDAVDYAPALLRRAQGVLRCHVEDAHEGGRWLIGLLLTHRPFWALMMFVSELLERETLRRWDAYVQGHGGAAAVTQSSSLGAHGTQSLPPGAHGSPAFASSLLDGIDGERRYVAGISLCAGVARSEVRSFPDGAFTALVATVIGASAFEAPPGSGNFFMEFPLMFTGGHPPTKTYSETHGTWTPVEDRICEPSPASQYLNLYCIWPGGGGRLQPIKTRVALTRGQLIAPATIELATCRIPQEDAARLSSEDIGTPTKPLIVELDGKRFSTTVRLDICIATAASRPWLTLCARPWFDSVASTLGKGTLQQFIEYHVALGVERFHIVDADGSAAAALQPYMEGQPGLIDYFNATLNSGSLSELAAPTGNLRFPSWSVHPTCQSFYFAHCMFRNRDSHWIINLPFFDKFISGAPGMRAHVLRELLASSKVRFARWGMPAVRVTSHELGAINIHRPSVLGNAEAPEDAPVTAQYFMRKNISAFLPECGSIRMYSRALVPIYRPRNVLMPHSGHWLWLRWGKEQCFAPVQRIWVNHYVRLGGKRWRDDHKDAPDPTLRASDVEVAVSFERKRTKQNEKLLADGAIRDESLLWTVPWFAEIADRVSAIDAPPWPLEVPKRAEWPPAPKPDPP